MKSKIPQYVIEIIKKLETAGFEGFVVGGCVRDILLNKEPKDWDVATNAKPEEVLKIFSDSVYENEFGTVGVKVKSSKCKVQSCSSKLKVEESEENECVTEIVEITTYRIESKYTDKRHPDSVKFAKTLEEDLSRRDFTINAMAMHLNFSKVRPFPSSSKALGIPQGQTLKNFEYEIIDPFGGKEDLKNKIIRAVGKADDRFNEDALRMMRAIRFASTLDGNSKTPPSLRDTSHLKGEDGLWKIEKNTFAAIKKNAKNLKYISQERIKDEFAKIILSPRPAEGIELLHETGLLAQFLPELEVGYDVTQSHHHYYGPYNTVYKHLVASLEKCPSPKLEVRLASLFHDIGKPKSKQGEGENASFYNHEYIGEKITRQILERLRFSRAVIDKTALLVRNHMFYYNVDEVGESGVRRVIRKVGLDNINDLIDVRIADRLGSGVPKAVPYKLRHFRFMVEKVSHDPVSVKQLKINGNDLIKKLKMTPGPKIGAILDLLLAEVIDNPDLNNKKNLLELSEELNKQDLNNLREIAKKKIKEEKEEEERRMKDKFWVK